MEWFENFRILKTYFYKFKTYVFEVEKSENKNS